MGLVAHQCMNSTWTFGVNDPDPIGWITTLAYLAVGVLCYITARQSSRDDDRGAGGVRLFWYAAAGLLVALGINKQLDLQTPFRYAARWIAMTEGWYNVRTPVKWVFVAVLAGSGMALITFAAWRLRRRWATCVPACLGIAMLLVYVAIRASPVQHVESLAGCNVSGVRGKRHMLELGAIAVVAAAAVGERKRQCRMGTRLVRPQLRGGL